LGKKEKKVKKLINYLKYPRKVAKNINLLQNKTSIVYKDFFIIPKVSLKLKLEKKYGGTTEYSWIHITINGKKLPFTFLFVPEMYWDNKEIDYWITQKITRTINIIEPGASRHKEKAKKVVEKFFNVKVKEIKIEKESKGTN